MKIDAAISESHKVGRVPKGIVDDAFDLLGHMQCGTIYGIAKEHGQIEQVKSCGICLQIKLVRRMQRRPA